MPSVDDLLNRKRVRDGILACRNCALVDGCSAPVPFSGPSPSPVAIVGEAPGADEDKQGVPFVGSAGRLLRGYLRHNGMDDQVSFLNVVSCYPNRTPTTREVQACADNLANQLHALSPRWVLVVGGVALSAFWPGERITDIRGNWWSASLVPEQPDVHFLATWHPAAVLRNSDLSDEFRIDIGDFAEVVHGAEPWRKQWCTKCNKEAKHWRAPTGASLGVPYCQGCYTATVGVPKMPKSRSSKQSRNKSQSSSML